MKKGFVKPKKLWTKKFEEKELEQIWLSFMTASPLKVEEWEGKSLTKVIKKYGQFVHPETDRFDDTEGVQPAHVRKILKKFKIEDMTKLFKFLSKMSLNKNPYIQHFITDGYISWESLFNQVIIPQYIEKYDSMDYIIGHMCLYIFDNTLNRYQVEEEVIKSIGKEPSILNAIKGALKLGIIKGNTISTESINFKDLFKARAEVWKTVKKIVPQSDYMLLANPNNFNIKLLNKFQDLFGVKQVAKMDPNDQYKVSIMINLFGINILEIDSKKLIKEIEGLSNLNSNELNIKDYRQMFTKFNEVVDLNLRDYYNLIIMFRENPSIYDSFKAKDVISKEDIELYFYINRIISYTQSRQDKESLLSLDLYYWRVFKRYGVNGPDHIIPLIQLYEKNKENKTTIPNIKGRVNKYEYELIKKDNPIGLILGYATDCCQVVGNNGYSCLIAGYERENSSFFVVKKKDRIYAQSWVWEKTTKEGKKIICFDSIEVLGKDLNKSTDILNAYKETAKLLVEEGYDYVIAGADGNSIPKGINSLGSFKDNNFINEHDLSLPFLNVYTDANEDIIIIKEK